MEGQVESDPSGSRAVAVSLAALKVHESLMKVIVWTFTHLLFYLYQSALLWPIEGRDVST